MNEIDYGNPQLRKVYDYVIVGAGPAGCVLANRLSEDPSVSVLILELGRGERPAFSEPPMLGPMLMASDYSFGYETERQKYGCLGLTDRKCSWTHGRGVGGSSIINNIIYTRGNRRDFDNWARAGMEGWSWKDVLPYYKKIEHANVLTLDEILRFRNGTGPLTSNSIESLLYVKSPFASDPDPDLPDVEVMQSFVSMSFDSSISTSIVYRLPEALKRDYYGPLMGVRNFMFLPMLMKTHTVGRVELKSRNPFHHPVFHYQYFEDERDVEALVYSIREVLRIAEAEPLQRLGIELYNRPVPGCEGFVFNSDDYWRCHVRTQTTTFQHQVSTCRMGPVGDPDAVVDPRLRVRGIGRLRVADVSIIPEPPSAHTCAMSYLIGEKAADMIKEDNQ
uniref:Glucose-methanol-choline oxidoreductase N-terminal domain-containing protein n=1 Tax=Anopheles quadriannulatus TaxID=34691 RepID=A0A182XCN7_ANOQN